MLIAQINVENSLHCWALLTGAGAVIGWLFKLLIQSKDEISKMSLLEKDRIIAELTAERKMTHGLAAEAIEIALGEANWHREKEGKPPIDPVPAVLPKTETLVVQPADAASERKAMESLVRLLQTETGRTADRPDTR